MEGAAFSANTAADLALIEDQGKSVGQKPDHGEHHQRRGLMDGGMLEVAVGGDGLKDLAIDSPATTAELMGDRRRRGIVGLGRCGLRPDPDGLPDARHGWFRGHAPDPRIAIPGNSRAGAYGRCDAVGPRAMPVGRYERLLV